MADPQAADQSTRRSKRIDFRVRWKPVLFFAALGPLALAIWNYFGRDAQLAEQYFGQMVYPITGQGMSIMSAWLPLALADIFVIWFVLWPVLLLIKSVVHLASGKRSLGNLLKRGFARVISLGGIAVFFFFILWGYNYQRPPIAERLKLVELDAKKSSDIDSIGRLLDDLRIRLKSDRPELGPEDKALVIEDREALFEKARKQVDRWAKDWDRADDFPEFRGHFGDPKSTMFSPLMAKFGITGMYFPYTGEPLVSKEVPDCRVPFVAFHEIGHQRGIAREDDASFFAWLASRGETEAARIFRYSNDLEIFYQTYSLLLRMHYESVMGKEGDAAKKSPALDLLTTLVLRQKPDAEKDGPQYELDPEMLGAGVVADLKAIQDYYTQHRGELADMGRKVNDRYLKASGQEQGVQAYNAVVTLILRERATRRMP